MFSCFLTCTEVQASIANSTSSSSQFNQISTNLSNEEFGKHILKKVYPRAVYDKWSKSWEDDDFFIDTKKHLYILEGQNNDKIFCKETIFRSGFSNYNFINRCSKSWKHEYGSYAEYEYTIYDGYYYRTGSFTTESRK